MGWDPDADADLDRKLAGLERLRQAGLITETAYQAQRAALQERRGAAAPASPAPPGASLPAPAPGTGRAWPAAPPSEPRPWPVPTADPVPLPNPPAVPPPPPPAWPVARAQPPAGPVTHPARPDLAYRASAGGAPGVPRAAPSREPTPPASLPRPPAPPMRPPIADQLPWEPPPSTAATRSGRLVATLCILALLVAGGGAVFLLRRGSSTPSQPPATPSTTTVDQFLPVAEGFVEQHRGLSFTKPVPVTLLGDAAFQARLLGDQPTTQSADEQNAEKELRALHLLPAGVSLQSTARTALGAAVFGFYDFKTKSLVVRGTTVTPYVREVMVHELTHAVQDQHFGLDRPGLRSGNDERQDAFSALYEGDAVRIQREYRDTMSAADQAAADAVDNTPLPSNIPQVVLELIGFPYAVGPDFVAALLSTGGQKQLDAAFVNPPTTSAQVIDPQLFLSGRGALPVPAPRADATSFDTGVLGEYGLIIVLQPPVQRGALSNVQVGTVGRMWGGDRYTAWDAGGGRSCLRDVITADAAADQSQLDAVLRIEAAGTPGVTLQSGSGTATVTFCG